MYGYLPQQWWKAQGPTWVLLTINHPRLSGAARFKGVHKNETRMRTQHAKCECTYTPCHCSSADSSEKMEGGESL